MHRISCKYFILFFGLAVLFCSCKGQEKKENLINEEVIETTSEISKKIEIVLESQNNTDATGKVVLKEEDGAVTITALVSGLSTGEHSVFIEAKDHNDSKLLIGKLIADESGNGTFSSTSQSWCLGCEDTNKDIIGKAFVIYSSEDKTKISFSVTIE